MSTSDNKANSIASSDEAPQELTAVVDDLLNQLTNKFSTISSEMLAKMDEMSKRLDNLEATIQQSSRQDNPDDSKQS